MMAPSEDLLDRLQRHARERPHAPALVSDGVDGVTYAELRDRVVALGAELVRHGLGAERLVALALPKSAEYVTALLAVWWANAAFLPLDPSLPVERRRFVLADAEPALILTRARDAASFQGARCPIWDIGEGQTERAVPSAGRAAAGGDATAMDRRALPPDGEHLAYLIYTSGSSGAPKGVQVTFRGLPALFEAQVALFGLTASSRTLLLLSTSFDAAISDLGTTLWAGATLCLESRSSLELASDLPRVLAERRVTHLDLPPVLLSRYGPSELPSCLDTLIIGGEPCSPEVVRAHARRRRVVNVYGPTEATVCTSGGVCDPERWSRPLLGQPLPGVEYRVLDEEGREVLPGSEGELYIAGRALARGYHRRPELSAERFVERDGRRWFRTGDHVRLTTDGEWEFLGRLDRQLKVRGQLVAPEEIERCLEQHPEVRRAAVEPSREPAAGEPGRDAAAASVALQAFVEGPAPLDGAALRRFLEQRLPSWMVPQTITVLDALPETRTGKIDRARLRAVAPAAAEEVPAHARATGPFADLWCRVLGRAAIRRDCDFFLSGGDSLRVLALIQGAATLGFELTPERLYRHPRFQDCLAALTGGTRGMTLEVAGDEPARDHALPARVLLADVDAVEQQLQRGVRGSTAVEALPEEANAAAPRAHESEVVLLTGATGFLGSRLLAELLTERRVVGLVRAATEAEARERCERALALHGVTLTGAERGRLEVVCGDVTARDLGCAPARYAELAARVSEVFHLAAAVNLALPYEALRAPNLLGTAEVLRLLRAGRSKRLHFASTLSVFVSTDHPSGRLGEELELSAACHVFGGYAQSKWAAEALVRRAATAQTNVAVYRLGLITGDGVRSKPAGRDQLGVVCRGLARLGVIPRERAAELAFDVTPVDYAARALVGLAAQPAAAPLETFHLAGPRAVTLAELGAALRGLGVPLREVSYPEFLAAVREAHGRAPSPDWSLLELSFQRAVSDARSGWDLFQATGYEFEMSKARRRLHGSGVVPPEPTAGLLAALLRDLLETRSEVVR